MKLTIAKGELLKGLSRIQAIVEKRNSMPILANVLMEAEGDTDSGSLRLSATDLEVGIRGSHPASIEQDGGLTVMAKKLYEIVRELPDEDIRLESTHNAYLDIRCERSHFTLAGTSAEEYPTLPSFSPERTVRFEAAMLSAMVERTMYAASLDETRYNLNGVYLEVLKDTGKLRMVATDGHRLAMVDREVGMDLEGLASGVIIPRKGLAELKRLLDEDDSAEIELAFEGNSGLAKRGDLTLVMRLIEGEFPNYQQVVPKEIGHQLTLPTDRLVQALRRVVLLSSERSRAVKFELSSGRLEVSSNNPDLGDASDELDVDFDGETITIGFNARYLLDALGSLHAKEVKIGLHNDLSPVQLVPANDDETLAVVMPMRL
ncbi:MAG: DNA polymerase III subunit beta [Deltaproteobacteria bacterium]|nr:DNA polymerase III subunit beta [Deltaproteobacteria bacterium]MBW2385756.1 DNA polymerase III subunit beta [Deltaproteobacteria bacterium]